LHNLWGLSKFGRHVPNKQFHFLFEYLDMHAAYVGTKSTVGSAFFFAPNEPFSFVFEMRDRCYCYYTELVVPAFPDESMQALSNYLMAPDEAGLVYVPHGSRSRWSREAAVARRPPHPHCVHEKERNCRPPLNSERGMHLFHLKTLLQRDCVALLDMADEAKKVISAEPIRARTAAGRGPLLRP
jgi:hypothetical protein